MGADPRGHSKTLAFTLSHRKGWDRSSHNRTHDKRMALTVSQWWEQGDPEETFTVQVSDDGGLNQGENSGGGEKCSHAGCILNVEPITDIGCRFHVESERKKSLGPLQKFLSSATQTVKLSKQS